MTRPRIPRHRAPIIPVGSRLRWTDLPTPARIAVGVALGITLGAAAGTLALAAMGGAL
jgi:hypothetical protein